MGRAGWEGSKTRGPVWGTSRACNVKEQLDLEFGARWELRIGTRVTFRNLPTYL